MCPAKLLYFKYNNRKGDNDMTLLELFGKYYTGEVTDKAKIKEIYKNEDFDDKLESFLNIIFIKKEKNMKHEGNLFYREYDKDLNSYEANRDYEVVFGEDFLFTEGFAENGIAIVEDKEHIFKAIDTNGDTVFKLPIFVSAEGFYKNPEITVIKHGKSKGVVDRNGNIIFGCDFDEIKLSSYNDVHMAEYRGRWALIRNDGKRLTNYIFINPTYVNKQGYFVAKLEGKSIDNLYIFKADDSGYAAIDVIKNIDNYEIS